MARAFSAMAELRAAASRKPGVDNGRDEYKTRTEDDRGRGQTSTREATEEMKSTRNLLAERSDRRDEKAKDEQQRYEIFQTVCFKAHQEML